MVIIKRFDNGWWGDDNYSYAIPIKSEKGEILWFQTTEEAKRYLEDLPEPDGYIEVTDDYEYAAIKGDRTFVNEFEYYYGRGKDRESITYTICEGIPMIKRRR